MLKEYWEQIGHNNEEIDRLKKDNVNIRKLLVSYAQERDQANEHLDTVIRSLLMWDKTDNQIIVASIQGRDIATKIDGVNIVTLSNPQNHLFCPSEYAMYEVEIAEIFTQF